MSIGIFWCVDSIFVWPVDRTSKKIDWGSAAFNLLCIIAVCISAIPPGEAGCCLAGNEFKTLTIFSDFLILIHLKCWFFEGKWLPLLPCPYFQRKVHDCNSTWYANNILQTQFGSFIWLLWIWYDLVPFVSCAFVVARRVKSKSFPCSWWPPASPFSCGAHLNGAHRTNDPRYVSAWCGTVDGYNPLVTSWAW